MNMKNESLILLSLTDLWEEKVFIGRFMIFIIQNINSAGVMTPISEEIDEAFSRLRTKSIIRYDKFREVYYCDNMSGRTVNDYEFINTLMKKHWQVFSKYEISDYMN